MYFNSDKFQVGSFVVKKIINEITCEVDSDKNKYSISFTLKRERGETVMKSFLSKLNFIRRLLAWQLLSYPRAYTTLTSSPEWIKAKDLARCTAKPIRILNFMRTVWAEAVRGEINPSGSNPVNFLFWETERERQREEKCEDFAMKCRDWDQSFY